MTGSYHVMVQNNRVTFEFDIRRNITIVRGDSGTGKTVLMTLLSAYERLGDGSGVTVSCARKCVTMNNANWEAVVTRNNSCIVFADADASIIATTQFARATRQTDNYYVIITRECLTNLPHSDEEIYGIHVSKEYITLRKTYNTFYRLCERED